jgi:iron only hydrogenase large subunit-like protein
MPFDQQISDPMMGTCKDLFAEINREKHEDMVVISVMPCIAKNYEAHNLILRPMASGCGYVLHTRNLPRCSKKLVSICKFSG